MRYGLRRLARRRVEDLPTIIRGDPTREWIIPLLPLGHSAGTQPTIVALQRRHSPDHAYPERNLWQR